MTLILKSFWILFAFAQLSWATNPSCGVSLKSGELDSKLGAQDQILDLEQERERVKADIAMIRREKAELRPFKQRESLRQHLFKKYGENWLKQGSKTLADLAEGNKSRSQLSADELELVDGTLLYTIIDRCFEGADLKDDSNRVTMMDSELRLLQMEIDIEKLNAQLGSVSDKEKIEHHKLEIERIEKQRNLAQENVKDAQQNITRIDRLLEQLRGVKAYEVYRLNVGRFAPNISDFWRGLRYSEVPYPQ